MSDANDKEMTVFGLAKGMRGGLITFIMAGQWIAIVVLFYLVIGAKDDKADSQAAVYEKMIEYIKPTKEKMNQAAEKVIISSNNLDSATNYIIEKQKPQSK